MQQPARGGWPPNGSERKSERTAGLPKHVLSDSREQVGRFASNPLTPARGSVTTIRMETTDAN